MKKQKTAVDWFQEQIIKIVNGTCELSEIEIFTQAKQMEKGQIIEAWLNGYHKYGCKQPKQGSKYYLETYGKDENKAENNY